MASGAGDSKELDPVDDEGDRRRGLIPVALSAIKNALLRPVRPFVSRAALRAYLTTILVVITAFVLLGLAITAYILFYWSYIPRIGFERTIHLQFDNVYQSHDTLRTNAHPYPYGSVVLGEDLVSAQGYDVFIELVMPRTHDNQDAGNFMLEVTMYAPGASDNRGAGNPTTGNILTSLKSDISATSSSIDPSLILASSRRPAILPYRSNAVELIHKATQLPWYILGFRSEDANLHVPMFELLTFRKGFQNIPSTLRLEIQSTHRLQLYFAKVHFRARFRGLRWLMYNHRIISALFFITTFWTTEIISFAITWTILSVFFSKTKQAETKIKADEVHEVAENVKREGGEEDTEPVLSDTERTFPTLSGQAPLRYTSPTPVIKQEPFDEEESAILIPEAVARAGDADDEDEEDADFFDSGIGTSLDSSNPARRDSMRKRRGRQGGSGSGSSANVWREQDERGR